MHKTLFVPLTKRYSWVRINAHTSFFLTLSCLYCTCSILFTSCDLSSVSSSSTNNTGKTTLPTNNGSVTYNTQPGNVLLRTFYGGGNIGTLELSPDVSIYGDGTYVLGPGLQMREGKIDTATLQQLIHTLVDTDGLLNFSRQQFNEVSDQNATFLQLTLNNKQYAYQYGKFGMLQESAQDIDEYHKLDSALTTITTSLNGPTHTYTNSTMVLLVHQDFSPDLTQTFSEWTLQDFSLYQLAAYECGVTPIDQTGPNADTGCLTYTVPQKAYLPAPLQLLKIKELLKGHQEGEFIEKGLYYHVVLRPLLPDELPQRAVAMLGSQELTYSGVPLRSGIVPTPTPAQ